MPGKQLIYCSSCNIKHPRPVGRNCRRSPIAPPSAMALSVQSSPVGHDSNAAPQPSTSNDLQLQILAKLTTVADKVESIDQRVAHNKRAIAAQNSENSSVSTRFPIASVPQNSAPAKSSQDLTPSASAHLGATAAAAVQEEPLLPSVDYLKANPQIQAQVDNRVRELHQLHDLNITGNFRSQRVGGTGDILVKKRVQWPQNYVLTGLSKTRPTYDSLNPFQWMAGALRGALDLPSNERDHKLEYLASLLEDASDFSFESAHACHAVVLTTMEQDKCSWLDTHQLDRFRRNHTQRHSSQAQPRPVRQNTSNNRKNGKKFQGKKSLGKGQKYCVYFNDGYCKSQQSHYAGGVFYKHICSSCSGDHAAVDCPPTDAKN